MKKGKVILSASKLSEAMENGETKTIVIREDNALVIHEEEKVHLNGVITAPADFFENRKELISQEKSHVIFSKSEGRIELVIDETSYFQANVKGKLIEHPLIVELGINTKKLYTPAELSQVLKMNRFHFANPADCIKTVENLIKAKHTVTALIEKEQMNNGNIKDNYEVKVDTSIDLNFNLVLPIFVGFEKKKISVEMCLDVRSRAISLWLESVELAELLDSESERIIGDEIKRFDKVVLIEQA